ncbi:MAG: aminotransferase class I/II-fold pyridoxal phosphate-dependent enzyme, partial [Comamonadaceae bacterium]|nr:aminotransferase class I/II-fold pyridoxal phosphate-dependent enzyme [Comamonadaceae bacterium]
MFTAILDPGDEVIIPAPYWVSYAELVVKLTGEAVPVIVETEQENNFKLHAVSAFGGMHAEDESFAFVQPGSNPTGSMYSPEDLGALADVAIQKDLVVMADEIYERLVYGNNKFASFATVRPGLQDRTILINGVSKTYAMTGWRIGWSISPANIAKAIADLQSQETSNPCSIQPVQVLSIPLFVVVCLTLAIRN